MQFTITCICDAKVHVDADSYVAAIQPMVIAMDEHVAQIRHPDVPSNLTDEQKVGMVRATMQQDA
ncbi:MAG: hypothetical protein HY532_03740 [Chloroflexi bacterium]|nr:hypothetical protein [Chloroflexota bacterium]